MITEQQARDLLGRDLLSATGERVGRIGQIFLDDETGTPEWVTVHTGLFGTSESFVPLANAEVGEVGLTVSFDRARIKDAPHIDVDAGHLSREEEAQLYEYYGLSYSGTDEASPEAPSTPGDVAGSTPGMTEAPGMTAAPEDSSDAAEEARLRRVVRDAQASEDT